MGPPAASPVNQKPPFICGSTQDYTFCAPVAAGDYYLAVTPNPRFPQSQDSSRIQTWFRNQGRSPQVVANQPEGITIPNGTRLYKVTEFLPKIISVRNGSRDEVPGPNCYQAALSASAYTYLYGRYVDTEEFRYYLKRDFSTIPCENAPFGSLVVYGTNRPSANDGGIHAAFSLLGALIFQKGGPRRNYPYEIAPRDRAMNVVDSHWTPSWEDRFGDRTKPDPNQKYEFICYQKRPVSLKRETSAEQRDVNWFLPLFKYYSRRIEDASKIKWSEFPEKRIDLLAIENMWRVVREFRDNRVGMFNPLDKLLKIDDAVSLAYLKIYSLSWQYDEITRAFDPIRDGTRKKQLEELYKKHYVTYDANFYEELRLYLTLMGVSQEKMEVATQYVVKKIQTYNPVQFSQSGGAQGIPYLDILKEAIQANK